MAEVHRDCLREDAEKRRIWIGQNADKTVRRWAATVRVMVCALFLSYMLLVLGLGAQSSPPSAQEAQDPTVPQQPLAPLPSSAGEAGQSNLPPAQGEVMQNQPDTHALSGVEGLTTGSLHRVTSIFDPGLYFSDYGSSVPPQSNSGSLTSAATVIGTLNAAKVWGSSNLAFTYDGSDTYYYPYASYGPRNLPSDSLGLSAAIVHNRWTFRFRDSFLYSWQAGFGGLFTGGPGLENQGSLLPALQPSLNPLGTILTGFARQLNDISLAEADYSISRRTTVTLSGSYGLLHFIEPGYLNSQTINGRAGYNYALSSKNTLALLSEYDRTSFSGTSTRFDSELVEMSFGRKITGRLAVQLAAGPELIDFHDFGPSNGQQLSWSVSGSLTRQTPRTGYFLSYFRGVTPGSGVYFGSYANTLTSSLNRRLSQSWSASLNGGYAASSALVPSSVLAGNFKDWFAGANLGKQLGRRVRFGMSYQYQRQIIASGACPVVSCGVHPSYEVFGVTIGWHPWSKSQQ